MSNTPANPLPNQYTQFFLSQPGLGLPAVWPWEGSDIEIGTYGMWRDGMFTPAGNLADIGVSFALSTPTLVGNSITAISKSISKSEAYVDASGRTVIAGSSAAVRASITYTATKANSFVVKLTQVYNTVAKNLAIALPTIPQKFQEAASGSRWDVRWRIITGLWTAESYFMYAAVSESSAVTVDGSASAVTSFGQGQIDAGLSVSSITNGSLELLQAPATPPIKKAVAMSLASITELKPLQYKLEDNSYSHRPNN